MKMKIGTLRIGLPERPATSRWPLNLEMVLLPFDEAVFVMVSVSDGREDGRAETLIGRLNNSKTVRDIPYVSMRS